MPQDIFINQQTDEYKKVVEILLKQRIKYLKSQVHIKKDDPSQVEINKEYLDGWVRGVFSELVYMLENMTNKKDVPTFFEAAAKNYRDLLNQDAQNKINIAMDESKFS